MHSNIYIEDEILPVWYDRLLIKHEFSTATEYATTSFTGPDTFTCNAVIQPGPSFYFSFVTRDAIQPIFRNWPLVKAHSLKILKDLKLYCKQIKDISTKIWKAPHPNYKTDLTEP